MRFRLPSRRRLVAGGLAVLALGGGVAGIAVAQGGGENDEPSYRSSVTVAETNHQDEAAEAQQLRSVARISPEQARDAALRAVPGTAKDPKLENENGNVVYEVLVTDSKGAVTDVKVDAGNGSVLAKEAEEAGDDEGGTEDESKDGAEHEKEDGEGAE
jgi:uncharacterized membrane protein YkoI